MEANLTQCVILLLMLTIILDQSHLIFSKIFNSIVSFARQLIMRLATFTDAIPYCRSDIRPNRIIPYLFDYR